MKKFLRLTAALMAVFAMTNFIACSDGGSSSDDDLTITAESDVKEVEVGKTIELTVVGTDADVTWTSSDTAIATVADGTVTGVKAGEVTITAKASDGKTGTIKITVKAASSSGDSGSTGGSGSGDSGSTGGSGSGDSGSTGGTGSGDSGSTGGSGSGDSGSTGGTGEYKVVYNGETVDKDTYTLEEAKALAAKYGLAETTDYKIDEAKKEIVLTASGKEKVDAAMGGGSGEKPVGEYKVVYAGETYMGMEGLTLEDATAMATEYELVENTDYTINNETKIITLTDSGKAKVEAAMGGDPGAGGVEVTFPLSADFTALAKSITAQIDTGNKALLVDEGVFVDANSQIPLIAVKAGTKVGTTQGTPTFSYADAKGIMVKRDGLYVPTSKLGKTVKVTVTAYMNSTSARNLELTAGKNGTPVVIAAPLVKGAMDPVNITVPAGEDLYIGASNELYISSIVIAAAE